MAVAPMIQLSKVTPQAPRGIPPQLSRVISEERLPVSDDDSGRALSSAPSVPLGRSNVPLLYHRLHQTVTGPLMSFP